MKEACHGGESHRSGKSARQPAMTTRDPAVTAEDSRFIAPTLTDPQPTGVADTSEWTERTAHGPSDVVRIIRDAADVMEIAEFWRSSRVHRDADIDYFMWGLEAFPHVLRPHVLVYYRDGAPRALLVGRCELRPLNLKLGYFRISSPPVRILTFINGGHAGEVSALSCSLFVDSIRQSLAAGEADAATIVYADVESRLFALGRSRPAALLSDRLQRPSIHRYWRITPNGGSLLAGLSKGERQQCSRKARLLQRDFDGQVRIACFRDETDVERLAVDAELVAKKTYQRRLRVGFADTAEMRRRLGFEARMGWLRGYILYLAGAPAAFWIASLYHGTLFVDFLGFDPAFAKYSPGIHLILAAVEALGTEPAEAPLREIDFGIGEAEYKRRFGNHSRHESCVFMFAPSFRGLRLSVTQMLVTACNNCVASLLAGTGTLSRLKRAWRRNLSSKAA